MFQVPTINQETTVANTEPIDVLNRFRSGTALRPKGKAQGAKVHIRTKDFIQLCSHCIL